MSFDRPPDAKSSSSTSRNHFGFGAPTTSNSTRIGVPSAPSSASSKRQSFHFHFDDDNRTVVLSNDPKTIILTNAQSSATETTSLLAREAATSLLPKLTGDETRAYFRRLGIVENITILEMDRDHFLKEEGIQELGRGGEGAVYFTHGHVVKVVEPNYARAALREIVHILYLNPLKKQDDGLMSTRFRDDFPTLIWIYVLTDGALAIGMEPFDKSETDRGGTLEQRLKNGPPMRGDYLVRLLLGLSRSLAHVHNMGIIHHDLKPANIYLPADKMKPPIVFDLGQALWYKSAWGKEWLRNEHNAAYWYNGSFRYMHWPRRRAHLAALHALQGKPFEPRHIAALQGYIPSYYADVFAFGRILRDICNSPFHQMNEKECAELRDLSRRLMGLHPPATVKRFSSKFLPIVLGLRAKNSGPNVSELYSTMDKVIAEVEKVLNRFELVL